MTSAMTAIGLLTVLLFIVPPAAAADGDDSAQPQPVHQVLGEKPTDLMLNYFIAVAADLPPGLSAPNTLEEWQQRREKLRGRLWESLGNFPRDDRPPLNAKITGRIDHGDHVVEKVLYESLPGLYVTALAYVPKNLDGRAPAVICVNGHWPDAKVTEIIQRRCMALARMGVIAFCQDVIGTGERQAFAGSPPQTYHGFYRGAAPRIVDRSLLGYVMFECIRALDYLSARDDVDPARVMCTGASGGGKQSMFFAALDDRLAGAVPVCYVSSYQAHMGATACVGEVPTNILRYSNQSELLGLHAPRPLLCIAASQDVPVFQPKHVYDTLERTSRIYRLYDAEDRVRAAEVDSKHDYNQQMRELLYRHVAKHLLGSERQITEPDDLPVESADALRVGLPADSETMTSLTFRRAQELTAAISVPEDSAAWERDKRRLLAKLEHDIFGGFPDSARCKSTFVRKFAHHRYNVEQWTLEPEPGIVLPCVLCVPADRSDDDKRPAVLLVDEDGKQHAFERGLIDRLVAAGHVVLAIDYRGAGETAGTVPGIAYGPGTPEYNLSNYGLFLGRPITGMRVFDLHCATDFLAARPEVDPKALSICGRGRGALAGILAAAFDERIKSVAAEELLASWVFNDEFVDIGLSYLIPRILTLGDMPQLIACVSPRPVLLLNPVDGRRRPIDAAAARRRNQFAASVYALSAAAPRVQQQTTEPVEALTAIVDWYQSIAP